jgi:hypothetical protein
VIHAATDHNKGLLICKVMNHLGLLIKQILIGNELLAVRSNKISLIQAALVK